MEKITIIRQILDGQKIQETLEVIQLPDGRFNVFCSHLTQDGAVIEEKVISNGETTMLLNQQIKLKI